MESVVKVQRAALRAPRGQMSTACPREPLVIKVRCASLGGGPQAMSMCIVEGRQQRPGPPTAACGGNGGRARWARGLAAAAPQARYRGPGAAATRRELSRAIIAVLSCRCETGRFIAHAQPHGSCWALRSSVGQKLHGPECGRSLPLLLLDDPHRDRLRRRALRSPHFHSPIWKFARSGTLRVNTHARDPS